MKSSIKTKLTMVITAILIGIISLQVVFNQYFARPYFTNEKSKQIERLYDGINEALKTSHQNLDDIILPYEENQHLRITIWNDKDGAVYRSNENDLYYYQQEKADFKENPTVEYHLNERTGEESLMMLGIIDANGKAYYTAVETPISAVHHSVELILRLNLFVALGAVLIGGICVWFVGRRFTKPILEIDQVAQAVASLDFSKTVRESGRNDEIGTLGRNINLMSQQIVDLITELQAANKELEKDIDKQKQVDNMRKEFIANVSHELKSPLTLLAMACENLKRDMPHVDKAFYYDIIRDESLRMGKMVKELLEIAKLENGAIEMEQEPLDLSELVERVCSKNEMLFIEKKIRVEKEIEEGLIVTGDRFYLEQAVSNYLDNARRHAIAGGKVAVGLIKRGGSVRFCVYNEGDRIPQGELEKIWESFYKSDKAHTYTGESNAGLGLYIVKQILSAHGGEYGARNLKDGVEFWFSI